MEEDGIKKPENRRETEDWQLGEEGKEGEEEREGRERK